VNSRRAPDKLAQTFSHRDALPGALPQPVVLPLTGTQYLKAAFLEGLSNHERETVLAAASCRRFACTAIATYQGEPADQLFLLLKGSARYFFITPSGKKVYLLWLTPGQIFGATSLLARSTRFIVNTEVEKDTTVLVWRRDTILDLTGRYPVLLQNALSTACDYLVWYVASHLSLITHSGPRRLAHVLVSLATGFGQKETHGISLVVTNEQLANTANITHFTVSRLLSRWQREGVLVKSRGRILLRNPELLFHNRFNNGTHHQILRRTRDKPVDNT
jgi:CRP/FNR family transcriptional regulator, nitrogen oxide reductase regulator